MALKRNTKLLMKGMRLRMGGGMLRPGAEHKARGDEVGTRVIRNPIAREHRQERATLGPKAYRNKLKALGRQGRF